MNKKTNSDKKSADSTLKAFRLEVDTRFEQVDTRFEQVDKHLKQIDKHLEQVDKRMENFDERFHHAQLMAEDTNRKVQLILEVVTKNAHQYVGRDEFDACRVNFDSRIAAIEYTLRK